MLKRGKEWDDINQNIFTRVYARRRYPDRESLVAAVAREIPGMMPEIVDRHVSWYERFLELHAAKKAAIAAWKAAHAQAAEATKEELTDIVETETMEKKKEVEREKHERTEKKTRIQGWKHVLQIERKTQEELEEAARIADAEKQKKKRIEQAQKRAVVQKYRDSQREKQLMAEEAARKRDEEEQSKRKEMAALVIAKSQKRVQETNARISLLKESRRQEQLKRRKIQDRIASNVKVNASRDPDRLLRPTAVTAERSKKGSDGLGEGLLGEMNARYCPAKLPHRSVPGWRQGL